MIPHAMDRKMIKEVSSVESVSNWLASTLHFTRFNAPVARACPARLPAILGTSHGNEHRIASDREACLQICQGLCEKSADQIARPVSKNVPRIDSTTGHIL